MDTLIINFIMLIGVLILVVTLSSIYLSVNTVFSVLSLIIVFLMTSCILFMLDFEFYAIVLTTLYVGAIAVFFLFVLMTINLRFEDSAERSDEISDDRVFSVVFLFLFSFLLHFAFYFEYYWYFKVTLPLQNLMFFFKFYHERQRVLTVIYQESIMNMTNAIVDVLPTQISVNAGARVVFNSSYKTDVHLIALNMFSEMSLLFIVITFILLFAMVSAIGFAVRSKS